jgi:hypothetical protein
MIGLVLGTTAGFVLGRSHRFRSGIILGLIGAATGAIGGALCPVFVAAGSGLRPEAACAIAWAIAGFLAGPAGYVWSRWNRPANRPELDWSAEVEEIARGRWPFPGGRVLLVWIVSGLCLVAVVGTPFSPAWKAVLAAGVLGVAVAWALGGQERRIRELERRLAETDESADRRLAP